VISYKRQKKIVISTPWDALAHYTRCFSIGKCLYDSGFKVFLLVCDGSPFLQSLIKSEKVDIDCFQITTTGGNPKLHGFKFDFYANEDPSAEFIEIENFFNNINPDIVLSDAYLLSSLVCEKLNIPHVSLASACWTNHYLPDRPSLRRDWIGQLFGNPFRWLIRQRMRFFFNKNLGVWADPLNNLARSMGLKKRGNIFDFFSGNDLTLITDTPEFGPLNNPPDHFKYCGPILWQPPFRSVHLANSLNPDKKIIYISFGSTGNFSVLENIVCWLLNNGYQIVMTMKGLEDFPRDLKESPNLISSDLINAWDVLPRCDAVIFHGGIGTAYQALACGKPSIVIPFHLEQCWNANRIEEIGAGFLLHHKNLTKRRLLAAIDKVIHDVEMQLHLKESSKKVISVDSAKKASKIISDFSISVDSAKKASKIISDFSF
jgi:UDP:flavonoid glycosyltransferase YjiC (YdhE family)